MIELYTADWCPSCRTIKPLLEGLEVTEINVDKETEKAISLGIRNIPVLRFLKDGMETGRIVGITTRDKIEEQLK